MDQTIAIRLFFCLNNFDLLKMLRMKSRPACLGHGQQAIDILLLYLEIEDIEVCFMRCGAEDFGRGRTFFAGRSADRFAPDFCRIFSQAPEPEGPPEVALCQGDSMPPPVCRGSGRTVMFHTADSRGEIQTDQSWGRYWRFSERAGGAAAGNCRHRWHALRLHHKAAPTHASFPLPVASNPRRGRAGANE